MVYKPTRREGHECHAGEEDELVSFELGLSKICDSDLDQFATKYILLERSKAWSCEGEVVPDPRDNEVVVFSEFFVAGLRFLVAPFVLDALKWFKLWFHQLTPSCFTKLLVYV